MIEDLFQPNTTIQCATMPEFNDWLATNGGSIAITTYQAGKLMFIGWNGKQVTLHARSFERAMGLDIDEDTLVLATKNNVHWFENTNVLATNLPDQPNRYDALYLPRVTYYTGNLFVHDISVTAEDVFIVNTRFSCVATLSHQYSFIPYWRPKFISENTPDDCCHLNGLAMKNGKPHTVTALGVSDVKRGWKPHKATGGVVIDIPTGEIILQGLSMPHSPRWHNDRLLVLNSGTGELLQVDASAGRAETICSLPGYLRGMTLVGNTAIVGLCKIREKNVFGGLPIELKQQRLLCGIALVDIQQGNLKGIFEFTSGVEEIYDIRFLPQIKQPNLLTNEHSANLEGFTTPSFAYWIKEKD